MLQGQSYKKSEKVRNEKVKLFAYGVKTHSKKQQNGRTITSDP